MTQTPTRPQTPWVVDLPPNDIIHYGRASFQRACCGHEQMGAVLSYFVYEASWKAKNEGIDVEAENCTAITLELTQKDVLKRVNISQKTLITYLHTLEEWGFITADSYRYTYTVHFKKIREAVVCPPEPLPTKPRGKHAYSGDDRIVKLQSKLEKLQREMVKLQSEIVKLQSKNVNLQSSVVNLQSSESCESTPEQGLEGNSETPRILRIRENTENIFVASAHAESNNDVSFCSQEEIPEETKTTPVSSSDQRKESTRATPTALPGLNDTPVLSPSLDKTQEKGNSKNRIIPMKECSPEVQERRRRWQEYFNKRRGGEPLPKRGRQINESACIASLVDTYTDAQITAIDTFVITEKFPHHLPINRHKVGGHIILDESQNAREVLKERKCWPSHDTPQNESPVSPTMTAPVTYTREDKYTAFIRKKAAEGRARTEAAMKQGAGV